MAATTDASVVSRPAEPGSTITPAGPEQCVHCKLPVPRDRRRRGDSFCCDGCARVFELIHDAHLDRFYELRRGSIAPPADLRPDSFAWLDRMLEDSAAPEGAVPAAPDGPAGTRCLTLDVQGVHCAACVWLLQELFARHEGSVDLQINPAVGTARATWSPAQGDLRGFLGEAERFGYRFGPPRKRPARRSRALLVRLGVCAALAMNAMIFSLSFYFGLAPSDGVLYGLFGWLNFALGTAAVAVGGPVFFRGAWLAARRRLAHLDLPISLGIVLAYGGSVAGHLTRGPEAGYFDSLTIFITLMLLGRWLQERILERNRQTLLAAAGVEGISTRRLDADGRLESVAATDVRNGDELWIVPGDLVPVEGTVRDLPARVSLDWINGESRPQDLEAGHEVPAGAFNADDRPLRLTARQDFADSRLVELLAQGPARTDTGGRWWHRVSTIYVSAVLTLATAAFLLWLPQGLSRALSVTVSVLVVTCPCALGLATPLAQEMISARLRRRGVFLREGTFTDRALSVRKILFDKTGTLTLGRIALTPEAQDTLARLNPETREVVARMAAASNHPVSRAVAAALPAARIGTGAGSPREISGQGMEWELPHGVWRLGSPAFAAGPSPNGSGPVWSGAVAREASRVVLSWDGHPVASLPYGEQLREDASQEVRELTRAGYEVHLLSGDTVERAEAAADALGIPPERARGRLSPEDKARRVAELDCRDTLMVGDGLNDSLSFQVAWSSATPAIDHATLPARADFYFLGGGIGAVRTALAHARRLRTVVRDNLILSTAYNLGALALCFAGLVTPVVAAVLMPVSSAAVVTLTAVRLKEGRRAWK